MWCWKNIMCCSKIELRCFLQTNQCSCICKEEIYLNMWLLSRLSFSHLEKKKKYHIDTLIYIKKLLFCPVKIDCSRILISWLFQAAYSWKLGSKISGLWGECFKLAWKCTFSTRDVFNFIFLYHDISCTFISKSLINPDADFKLLLYG